MLRRMSEVAAGAAGSEGESAERIRTPWQLARRRFFKNVLAVFGAVVLLVLLGACFGSLGWTLKATGDNGTRRFEDQHELAHVFAPPTGAYWMGNDKLSRDLWSRFLLGGAISLSIGLVAAAISVVIGTSVGLVAGYAGGRIDAFLMRMVDVLYGLPYILLVILMRVVLVPILAKATGAMWANVLVLLIGIGGVSWLTMARVVRGQVMSLRDQPFVEAARALGFRPRRILLRHILPNLVGPILVYATLTVPQAILAESFLSFLGLGIQDPLPTWGSLASEGVAVLNPIRIYWWLIVWPCVGLSVTLLCLNFVGDGLRDALDPKSR
jgi:oligopeptide transport system permease protein